MLAVLLTALVATVNAHTWTYERGALAAGHDLQKKNTTVTEVSCPPLVALQVLVSMHHHHHHHHHHQLSRKLEDTNQLAMSA